MLITVIDLPSRTSGAVTAKYDSARGFGDADHVLYVPLARSVSLPDVDTILVERADDWMLTNAATILGVHGDLAADVSEDVIDHVWDRLVSQRLLAITPSRTGTITLQLLRGEPLHDLDVSVALNLVRQADMHALLFRAGSHLPATDPVHYAGPNGHHYRAFLRPGFALHTVDDLDRVSFWLYPELRGRNRLVVDHWSLLGLAHHFIAYQSRVDSNPERAFVEALTSYDESRESLESRLSLTMGEPTDAKAALLLSINSSGALARDVALPSLEQAGHANPAALALASTDADAEYPVSALATLSEDFARLPAGEECPACAAGSTVVLPIQRDSYLLALSAYTATTAISRPDANPVKEVVEAYGGLGVFSVHRDHGDARHHAYYVDIEPMLDTDRFRRRLATSLSRLANPRYEVIIHPRYEGPARLAGLVARRLGVSHVIGADDKDLRALDETSANVLAAATRILVVDDVVITGRRIQGYRNQLIELRKRFGVEPEVELGCVVALARARHESALRGTRDVVHDTDSAPTFVAVETLFLPSWDQRDCSWCQELRVLTALADDVKNLPRVRSRIERLTLMTGLVDGLYFDLHELAPTEPPADAEARWTELYAGTEYEERYWELCKGSVFGDVQGADLATSIAAAVQRLRMRSVGGVRRESKLDETFRPPISKILDPDLYLLGRFYEPPLIAGLLRAARSFDVRSPGADGDLVDCLREHVSYLRGSARLTLEFLVQSAIGKLPVPPGMATLDRVGSERRLVATALATYARERRQS